MGDAEGGVEGVEEFAAGCGRATDAEGEVEVAAGAEGDVEIGAEGVAEVEDGIGEEEEKLWAQRERGEEEMTVGGGLWGRGTERSIVVGT